MPRQSTTPTRCYLVLSVLLALAVLPVSAQNTAATAHPTAPVKKAAVAVKPETPHLEFVTEYLRELAAMEEIRAKGQKEFADAGDDLHAKFRSVIYTNTLVDLELRSQISMMNRMSLHDPYDTVIDTITNLYADKFEVWKRMSDIAELLLADSPKPGVDYSAVTAEMPKLRARLDYLDQTLFQTSPLVFSTLIDTKKTNSKGKGDHLIITKEERTRLIDTINTEFGPGVDAKDANYLVSAASVVKSYLEKDTFKSADEPWE